MKKYIMDHIPFFMPFPMSYYITIHIFSFEKIGLGRFLPPKDEKKCAKVQIGSPVFYFSLHDTNSSIAEEDFSDLKNC